MISFVKHWKCWLGDKMRPGVIIVPRGPRSKNPISPLAPRKKSPDCVKGPRGGKGKHSWRDTCDHIEYPTEKTTLFLQHAVQTQKCNRCGLRRERFISGTCWGPPYVYGKKPWKYHSSEK